MTTIAVDIDEVLADTIKSMMEKYNYTWKWKKISFDDLTNYNLWEIEKLWMTKNQALWIFIKHQLFSWITKKIPPIKWAKEKLMELKSKWYKIYAVTARFSFMSFSTKRWIKKISQIVLNELFSLIFSQNMQRKNQIYAKKYEQQ